MSQDSNPLHGPQFRNMGIDTRMIEQEADKHNEAINKYYQNGTANPGSDHPETLAESMGMIEPKTAEQRAQPQETSVDTDLVKNELIRIMDQKIHELASKMQQFADETDNKFIQLNRSVSTISEPAADAPKLEVQQTVPESKPQANKEDEYKENDVSIDKIFNFSGNSTGEIRR